MKIKSQHIVTDGRLEIPKSILVKAGGYISRGVKGIAIEDGHLIFTLTDGTTADLGDIRGAQGLQQVCGVDRFLELFRSADIRMLSRHSLEITADTEPGVYVFPWPELLYSKEAQTE